jgi:hypothetical protein
VNFRPTTWLKFSRRSMLTEAEVSTKVDKLLSGKRSALSRTITMIESKNERHRKMAD